MRNLPTLRELPAAMLSPTARPTDTFVRPTAPMKEMGGADGVLTALSGVMPSLSRFVERREDQNAKDQEEAAANAIQGMTPEQRADALKNNSLPALADPYFAAAFRKGHGMRVAEERYLDLTQKIESGELRFDTREDATKYMQDIWKQDAESFGSDQMMLSGYRPLFDKVSGTIEQAFAKETGKRILNDRIDQFMAHARTIIQDTGGEGSAADRARTAHERIRQELYPTFTDLFHMKPAELDKVMLTLAKEAADKGDVDLVHEILFSERADPITGQKLGAIGQKRENASSANDIETAATQVYLKRTRESLRPAVAQYSFAAAQGKLDTKQFEEFSAKWSGVLGHEVLNGITLKNSNALERIDRRADANEKAAARQARTNLQLSAEVQADEALRSGKAASLGNVRWDNPLTGLNETIASGTERAKDALDREMQRLTEAAAKGTMQPVDAMKEMIRIQRENGMEWDVWSRTLQAGILTYNDQDVADGKVPENLQSAYRLYQQIAAVAPEVADASAGTEASKVYKAMHIANRFLGMNEAQAAAGAIRAARSVDNAGMIGQYRRENVERDANAIASRWWEKEAINVGWARDTLMQTTEFLVRGYGIDPKKAAEMARDSIKERTIAYRGQLIEKSSLGQMADQVDEYFAPFAEDWVKKHGEAWGVKKGKDLSFMQMPGTTTFMLAARSKDGMFVPIPAGVLDARKLYDAAIALRVNNANNRNR